MTTTTAAPAPIKLDPDATYEQPALAAALRVSLRQVQRWRDAGRRVGFPRPFLKGRMPCWRGDVVNAWLAAQQRAANAPLATK